MTENQSADALGMEDKQRAVLLRYPDATAARILGCSREWARQLRSNMNLPISTQEAQAQFRIRLMEEDYLLAMQGELDSRNTSWRKAEEFASVHGLPWPPEGNIEELQGVKIYRFAEKYPGFTWFQINVVFKVKNACSIARQAALAHNLRWPLRRETDEQTN